MYAIYGNIDPINIPQMLAYIPAPAGSVMGKVLRIGKPRVNSFSRWWSPPVDQLILVISSHASYERIAIGMNNSPRDETMVINWLYNSIQRDKFGSHLSNLSIYIYLSI